MSLFNFLKEKLSFEYPTDTTELEKNREQEQYCMCPYCRQEVPLNLIPGNEMQVYCPRCRKLFTYIPIEESDWK